MTWVNNPYTGRASAYPYAQWGHGDYMYKSLPRGWRNDDTTKDLYNFMQIFGALADGIKTDTEQLLNLFCVVEIHEDLLPLIDMSIGWPTWYAADGLRKREDTLNAISLYRIKGRKSFYEQILESITTWSSTIYEGWKYVFFTNDTYGSRLPHTDDAEDIFMNLGLPTDYLKYINSNNDWHSVAGLGIFLSPIEGTSDDLTYTIIHRFDELNSWGSPSYAIVDLLFIPEESGPV